MRSCLLVVAVALVIGCKKGKPTDAGAPAPADPPKPAPVDPKQPDPKQPTPGVKPPTGKTPPLPGWVEFRPPSGGFKTYSPIKSILPDGTNHVEVRGLDRKKLFFQGYRGYSVGGDAAKIYVGIYFHIPGTTPAQRAAAVADYFREQAAFTALSKIETTQGQRQVSWLGREVTETDVFHNNAPTASDYRTSRTVALDDVVYVVSITKRGGPPDPAVAARFFDSFELTPDTPPVPPTPK